MTTIRNPSSPLLPQEEKIRPSLYNIFLILFSSIAKGSLVSGVYAFFGQISWNEVSIDVNAPQTTNGLWCYSKNTGDNSDYCDNTESEYANSTCENLKLTQEVPFSQDSNFYIWIVLGCLLVLFTFLHDIGVLYEMRVYSKSSDFFFFGRLFRCTALDRCGNNHPTAFWVIAIPLMILCIPLTLVFVILDVILVLIRHPIATSAQATKLTHCMIAFYALVIPALSAYTNPIEVHLDSKCYCVCQVVLKVWPLFKLLILGIIVWIQSMLFVKMFHDYYKENYFFSRTYVLPFDYVKKKAPNMPAEELFLILNKSGPHPEAGYAWKLTVGLSIGYALLMASITLGFRFSEK